MAYVIRSGTPEKVRTSIFTRINTGGLTLTAAEIKNSVYRGQAANLLKELAAMEEFKVATRNKISPNRMLDCEFVNRFLAFYVLGIEQYKGNLEDYLNDVLVYIQKVSDAELTVYRKDFKKAMQYAYLIFEENAFRRINKDGRYGQINKPLFDAVAVNLAKLSEEECKILLMHRDTLLEKYQNKLEEEDFVQIISNGTATIGNVKTRHAAIRELFRSIIVND